MGQVTRLDLFAGDKTVLQAHMPNGPRIVPDRSPKPIVAQFGVGASPAPVFAGSYPVEQPPDAHARRRIEDADRVVVPPAVDQEGADPLAKLVEITSRLAAPLPDPAVL